MRLSQCRVHDDIELAFLARPTVKMTSAETAGDNDLTDPVVTHRLPPADGPTPETALSGQLLLRDLHAPIRRVD
jgi:hypothetical protein